MTYIKANECVTGHLYIVKARSFCRNNGLDGDQLAVYIGNNRFSGVAYSFGQLAVYIGNNRFSGVSYSFGYAIDEEIHWDTDERHGTLKPLKDLGEVVDIDISDSTALMFYLCPYLKEALHQKWAALQEKNK